MLGNSWKDSNNQWLIADWVIETLNICFVTTDQLKTMTNVWWHVVTGVKDGRMTSGGEVIGNNEQQFYYVILWKIFSTKYFNRIVDIKNDTNKQ